MAVPGCMASQAPDRHVAAALAPDKLLRAWHAANWQLCCDAGAPLPNTTFYCHATNQLCYWLRGTATNNNGAAKTYVDARYECKGLSGELVVYSSKREQLNVERYFGAQLPTTYWVGYVRQSAPPNGIPSWVGVDGTVVDQYPNNTSPYAHWSWNHYTKCVCCPCVVWVVPASWRAPCLELERATVQPACRPNCRWHETPPSAHHTTGTPTPATCAPPPPPPTLTTTTWAACLRWRLSPAVATTAPQRPTRCTAGPQTTALQQGHSSARFPGTALTAGHRPRETGAFSHCQWHCGWLPWMHLHYTCLCSAPHLHISNSRTAVQPPVPASATAKAAAATVTAQAPRAAEL